MSKIGILISNIGSPKTYQTKDVAKYLREFLIDKHVVTVPFIVRFILIYLIIVPFRAKKSAHNYKSVWLENGLSPLVDNTNKFAKKLSEYLPNMPVEIGYRYGDSVLPALKRLQEQGVDKIIYMPMYPQYAYSTTESAIFKLNKELENLNYNPKVEVLEPFYNQDFFIKPYAKIIKEQFIKGSKLVFSFHGLPENAPYKERYKDECKATAKLLADEIGESEFIVCFQSRLGRTEWIKPYTTDILKELGKQKASVTIVSPAFVADCIETIEELGMGEREEFIHAGGKDYKLIECLNDNKDWVEGISKHLEGIDFK